MKRLLLVAALTLALAPAAFAEKKDVTIKSDDGFELKGSYYASAKPGPGVLLLHQCNGDRKTWDGVANMLSNSGYHVLTFDFRGFGDSKAGEYTDFRTQRDKITAKFPADVDAAFKFLTSQKGVDKQVVGTGGASCGVNQAILLGSRHPEVKTLVLLSGGTDATGEAYIQKSNVAFLSAASEEDKGAADSIKKIFGLSTNKQSMLKMFNGAGHGTMMFAKEKQLESEIVDWFKSKLKTAT